MGKHPNKIKFNCKNCGKKREMSPSRFNHLVNHYCSDECKTEDKKLNRITYICDDKDCNNKKTVWRSEYAVSTKHFCSRKCFGKNRVKLTKQEYLNRRSKEGIRDAFKARWNKMIWNI